MDTTTLINTAAAVSPALGTVMRLLERRAGDSIFTLILCSVLKTQYKLSLLDVGMLVCKRLLGPLLNKTVSGKLWTRVPRNRCLKAQCRCQFRSHTGDITLPAIGMQLWPLMVEAARGANVPNNNTAMIHASVTP